LNNQIISIMETRGGARENAGRKPKSEELALIARLSPMDDLALQLLNDKLEQGDMLALKMFMEYRWSKPKQEVSVDGGLNFQVPAPNVYNTAPPLPHSENEVDV
jgi:hypothetical protein